MFAGIYHCILRTFHYTESLLQLHDADLVKMKFASQFLITRNVSLRIGAKHCLKWQGDGDGSNGESPNPRYTEQTTVKLWKARLVNNKLSLYRFIKHDKLEEEHRLLRNPSYPYVCIP